MTRLGVSFVSGRSYRQFSVIIEVSNVAQHCQAGRWQMGEVLTVMKGNYMLVCH